MNDAVEKHDKAYLGFWIYIITDLMLFATLFSTFMVLRHAVNGGPNGHALFDPSYALIETFALLLSSLTCGLALVSARYKKTRLALGFIVITVLLGISFLTFELHEFREFALAGHTWQSSAFLSGFFTLVGTHGAHITVGLIWAVTLLVYALQKGMGDNFIRKFSMFALFWHFLDIVWIFIFSVVYLIGGLA
jgi:cytochrome o ubiquinol oxidase subunit 3